MKKVKIIAGIIWAILCLIVMVAFFPGFNSLSRSVAKFPFMKINPNMSGGGIAYENIQASCTLVMHHPVFDGLVKERKNGFVQVDWRGEIKEEIFDTIDYDLNGIPDFCISINTQTADTRLDPINPAVNGIDVSTSTSYGWAARIRLKKE
jgi:hypothetical protein